MKNTKKIMILMNCQLFFVLSGCGQVGGPCSEDIILNIKSPDGVSIGSYSGEVVQNGKPAESFYCENDQKLSETSYSYNFRCLKDNSVSIPATYMSPDDLTLSLDVVVYSFNKEMKSQAHFDLEFKYPQDSRSEGCEKKMIEVILQ